MTGFFNKLRLFTAKSTSSPQETANKNVVNWVSGRKNSNVSTNSNASSVTASNNNRGNNRGNNRAKPGLLNRIFKKKGTNKNYATNVNTGALGEYSAPYYTPTRGNNTVKASNANVSFFNKIKRGITGTKAANNAKKNSATALNMQSSQFPVNSVADRLMTHYDIAELLNKAIIFSQSTKLELSRLIKNGLVFNDLPDPSYILYRDIYVGGGLSVGINDLDRIYLIPNYDKKLDKYYIVVTYAGKRIAILDNNNSFMNALNEKEKQYIREILDRGLVKRMYNAKAVKGVVYNQPYAVTNTENMKRNRTRRNRGRNNAANRRGVTFKEKVLVQEIPFGKN